MDTVITQYKGINITGSNFIALLFLLPFELLLKAVPIQVLWMWFVVPLGVPGISIAHAIGLSLLARFFVGYPDADFEGIDNFRDLAIRSLSQSIVRCIFALLGAWVVTLFM